jgi:hypothetical protein
MKMLLSGNMLLAGVLGFTSCAWLYADRNPIHVAIVAYLTESQNDPASYESVGWGSDGYYTRRDSASVAARKLRAEYAKTGSASLIKQALALQTITDTTPVGTCLDHTYRAKNTLGVTVLNSAEFVVYNNGKVVKLWHKTLAI